MSKLCKYCGAEMDDDAFECPECLKKYPGAELKAKQKAVEKKQKIRTRLIFCGICFGIIAVITGLTLILSAVFKKPEDYYSKPIKDYIDGCLENDYAKYMSAFTPYYGRYLSEQYAYLMLGNIPDDNKKIYTSAVLYLDNYYSEILKTFGNDVDISYKIYREKQYTPEELSKYQDEYINFYSDDLAGTEFTDGYELYIVFTAKGNLGVNNVKDENFMVFEINGEWKIMRYVDFLAKEDENKDVESYR